MQDRPHERVMRRIPLCAVGVLIALISGACDGGGDAPTGVPGADAGASAEEGGPPSNASASVTGTVTLPSDATGRCAMVAIDTDTTGSNGSARRADGTYLLSYHQVTGTSLSFSFEDVPSGTYYLWAYVDTDGSSSSPSADCEIDGAPSSGDFLGYYDTGLSPPPAPNLTVPGASGTSYAFKVDVFP